MLADTGDGWLESWYVLTCGNISLNKHAVISGRPSPFFVNPGASCTGLMFPKHIWPMQQVECVFLEVAVPPRLVIQLLARASY